MFNRKKNQRVVRRHSRNNDSVVLSSSGSVRSDVRNIGTLARLSVTSRPKTWGAIGALALSAIQLASGDINGAIRVLTTLFTGV